MLYGLHWSGSLKWGGLSIGFWAEILAATLTWAWMEAVINLVSRTAEEWGYLWQGT